MASNGGADTQVIDGILKDYYEDFIAEQVNNKNPFKDFWRFEQVPFAGREVVYTSHISRNVSPMFVGEDSAFADAGAQGHVQVRVGQRKLMGRIRMTSEAIQDSMSSKGAFKAARKDETDGLIKDLARKEEYALCSDGRGVLCLVNTATPNSDGVTCAVDSPGGVANTNFGSRFLQKGMYVAFVDPTTGILRAGARKIVSLVAAGTSMTLDAAPGSTVANNDYVVQAANSAVTDILDTSYEHAFWGMLALVDDGTYRNNYFGVDRSVQGTYQSYVKASTGALSFDLLQQVSDILDQRFGTGITDLVAHHGIRRLFLNMLETDRRYTGSDLKAPDGMTKSFRQGDLTIGEVPMRVIRDWPLDIMALLNKGDSGWVCYQSEAGKWVDEDGSVLVRHGYGSAGRDAFEAWYRMRKQFHVRYPGYNARLDGITGQSFVVARAE
jgi:hypothetical protein